MTRKARRRSLSAFHQFQGDVMYAFIDFRCTTEVTRERDPNDRWSGEDTSSDWSIPDTFKITSEERYGAEPLKFEPKKGKDYFVVYAIWSTGDSFSRSHRANCECFGVYETYEEAEKREAELKNPEPKKHDFSPKSGWLPWYGYFESLDETGIKRMMAR